jgi:hypothetical protein
MTGAALPDLDKPALLWFGRSPWPRVVNYIHIHIQREAPHRFKYEAAAAVLLFAAAAGLLRGSVKGA